MQIASFLGMTPETLSRFRARVIWFIDYNQFDFALYLSTLCRLKNKKDAYRHQSKTTDAK